MKVNLIELAMLVVRMNFHSIFIKRKLVQSSSSLDNCVDVFNGDQVDTDNDGLGDACDPVSQWLVEPTRKFIKIPFQDIDNDGILNENDNCPTIANRDQKDVDFDKIGDVCDNCQNTPNMLQNDSDA